MLAIRSEQLAVFERDALANYVKRLADELSSADEAEGRNAGPRDRTERLRLAAYAVDRCKDWGIENRRDISKLAHRMRQQGPRFELLPENRFMRVILESKRIAGRDKVGEIHRRETASRITGKTPRPPEYA